MNEEYQQKVQKEKLITRNQPRSVAMLKKDNRDLMINKTRTVEHMEKVL